MFQFVVQYLCVYMTICACILCDYVQNSFVNCYLGLSYASPTLLLSNPDQLGEVTQSLAHIPGIRLPHNPPYTDRGPSVEPSRHPSVRGRHHTPLMESNLSSMWKRYRHTPSTDQSTGGRYHLKNLLHRRFTDVLVDARLGRKAHGTAQSVTQAVSTNESVVDQQSLEGSVVSTTHPVQDMPTEVCHQPNGDTVRNGGHRCVVIDRRALAKRGTCR